MDQFGPLASAWFTETFETATPVQELGWPRIAAGEHALLVAPTGSGKTLAAFLWCIDRLSRLPPSAPAGTRVVYVSPLKALVYDIERNLRAPLEGVAARAAREGATARIPRVDIRTGDTSTAERRRQAKSPADILVTTPESLFLLLGSAAREGLRSVETVIVDEIHTMAATKRGAHLALSMERLAALTGGEPQRLGLSATVRPVPDVACYLGGGRPVATVDVTTAPQLDLRIIVPVDDMKQPTAGLGADGPNNKLDGGGMWPAVYQELLQLIDRHRSTIVFVNARGLCERLCRRLNEIAGRPLAQAHHGSIAREQREVTEQALKDGKLKAIVATSSLELGIDMGAVDLVVLVESPGSAARGLQRVGRAGHHVGEVSKGRLLPKHRGDLLECAVVGSQMAAGAIEPLRIPHCPLDVLAQQLVAICSEGPRSGAELLALARRAHNYRDLSRDSLDAVLDMLSGRYPSTELADLRPRLNWDRNRDELAARSGAIRVALANAGTIPDRGLYGVVIAGDGARVGELDEEMVHETRLGDIVTLGASSWQVDQISRDRVVVRPAPGRIGRLPFWHGDRPGRPSELGRELGRMVRKLASRAPEDAVDWVAEEYRLEQRAARNVVAYVHEQKQATGVLPTDQAITIERFVDEVGDWRICILSPFGARVHAPWALGIRATLGARSDFDVQMLYNDDGITLHFVEGEALPDRSVLLPAPDEIEQLVVEELPSSGLFAGHFRENAARALLLPRRRPGARVPLWAQRLKAQKLLGAVRRYPSFPIVLETYRSCMQDVFDVPALRELLQAIDEQRIVVDEVETPSASPFARSLVFSEVAIYMYEGDVPAAERRAHAVVLDRKLLRELLGPQSLGALLDPEVVTTANAELQCLSDGRRAGSADELHDLLRALGDMNEDEVAARCAGDGHRWLKELQLSAQAIEVEVAGQRRWVAAEDAALYRDGLGVSLPATLPPALLGTAPDPIAGLLQRWARRRGPFSADHAAERFGLTPADVLPVLQELCERGALAEGTAERSEGEPCDPAATFEWCDVDVMRRLRRRTLDRLRQEIAPVSGTALARFLPRWHGLLRPGHGPDALRRAIERLEGLPLSFAELERLILPARVADYRPRMLDELGAGGEICWVGAGALRGSDGRVLLLRRDRVDLWLADAEPVEPLEPLQEQVLGELQRRGATFFLELLSHCAVSQSQLHDALWCLVWAGLVTNDTFQPLRAQRSRSRGTAHRRASHLPKTAGGRWSLVRQLSERRASPTERAHARAQTLLDRYGVLCRQVAAPEGLPGGFSAIYGMLRELEDAGAIRRGHFVAGLSGAQFAAGGTVDRLRAARDERVRQEVQVLAVTDPANPYGGALPWPEPAAAKASLRRAVGAQVVSVDGAPALYLDRNGRRLWTFATTDDDALEAAVRALGRVASARRSRFLRVESIDGAAARPSRHAPIFTQAGFTADHKGLVLEAR